MTKVAVALGLGIALFAPAAFVFADQPDSSVFVGNGNGGDVFFKLATTTSVSVLSSVGVVVSATSTDRTYTLQVTCFANSYTTSQAGCTSGASRVASTTYVVAGGTTKAFLTFYFSPGFSLQSGKVYLVEILADSAAGSGAYGRSGFDIVGQCTFSGIQGCTGTPYYQLNQTIDWSLPSSQVAFPLVFSASSSAIAASSSLWGAYASTSSLVVQCSTGNLFSDGFCTAINYLFVPNPNTLNQFFTIPSVVAQKFPFSWIYGVKTTFDSLSVSSTTAMTTLSYNFHDLGIGSTTPMGNILPNVEVFSKSTIETYISPSLWATFQVLISAGMWLGFVWFEFNRARRLAMPH